MLNIIQNTGGIRSPPLFNQSDAIQSHLDLCKSQELLIMAAMATILVRDDLEAVAVVANHQSIAQPPALLITHHHILSSTTTTARDPNPSCPDIIAPVIKPVDPLKSLLTGIYSDNQLSFPDHVAEIIGALNQFMETPDSDNDHDAIPGPRHNLFRYLLAKSIRKLLRSSTHPKSKEFRSLLESITLEDVNSSTLPPVSETLSSRQSHHDRFFLRTLRPAQAHLDALKVDMPHLTAIADAAGSRMHTFYNENTRGEIHVLLIALLKDMDDTLEALRALIDDPPSTTDGDQTSATSSLSIKLGHLWRCMFTLMSLTYSSALEFHLAAMALLLSSRAVAINLHLDEMDERIYAAGHPEWPSGISNRSYTNHLDHMDFCGHVVVSIMRWLRQRVAIVKSIFLVWNFADRLSKSSSPPPKISARCVSIDHHQERQMVDWRHIVTDFTDRKYFDTPSAEKAIDLLLGEYRKLEAENVSFKGSVHSEAYLASLARSEETPQHIRQAFEDYDTSLIGVSARCCMVCTCLIEVLSTGTDVDSERINVGGSHNTVYPCALPSCLPIAVIQRMVDMFENILLSRLRRSIYNALDAEEEYENMEHELAVLKLYAKDL